MRQAAVGPAKPGKPAESELAKFVRYTALLGVGFASLFVLVLSLMASIQVIAHGAGFDREATGEAGLWGLAATAAIGALPLFRFTLAEAPKLVSAAWFEHRKRVGWFTLAGLAIAAIAYF